MVFFTCNNCGESVKKPAVEKHYNTKCRGNAVNVSCMDCLQDFRDDFVKHTKCISEAQKYSGKNFVAKESKNTGAKKQESWMDIVRSILESSEYQLKPEERSAFQKLQNMENVPRKKGKFENYTKSCLRFTKPITAKVWAILEKELEKMKAVSATKRSAEQNGNDEPAKKKAKSDKKPTENGTGTADIEQNGENKAGKKKSKKSKTKANGIAESEPPKEDDTKATENGTTTANEDAFDWSTVIEKLVKKQADGITLDKLKIKVQKKYKKKIELDDFSEKLQKKFEKKFTKHMKKCPGIQVENDLVRAC